MKTRKRQALEVAKAERRPLRLGPGTSVVDDRREGKWVAAKHRVCVGPGEINRYWFQAVCYSCAGAVPAAEMVI